LATKSWFHIIAVGADPTKGAIVMGRYKCNGLVWLRNNLTDEQMHALISKLSHQEYALLTRCIPSKFEDAKIVANIFSHAACFFEMDRIKGL
jgi:hypothetical protein